MTDPAPSNHRDPLADVRSASMRVQNLEKQLKEAKQELRSAVVSARRDGELISDIQQASGWSHQTVNTVVREAGIPADRSAPRKRRTVN
jgi:hypothetical protein